jgi:hypothetical protein
MISFNVCRVCLPLICRRSFDVIGNPNIYRSLTGLDFRADMIRLDAYDVDPSRLLTRRFRTW